MAKFLSAENVYSTPSIRVPSDMILAHLPHNFSCFAQQRLRKAKKITENPEYSNFKKQNRFSPMHICCIHTKGTEKGGPHEL